MAVERAGRGWVRVIAGRYRGLRLATVAGNDVRPTADRVRESLFGILGDRVVGARVLDCFAGTGALGIEALSRGAVSAAFVEKDARVLEVLRSNLGRAPQEAVILIRGDALHSEDWQTRGFPAHLVFADPPYRRGIASRFLDALSNVRALEPENLVVLEHERELVLEHPAWTVVDRRQYGDTAITFLISRAREDVT